MNITNKTALVTGGGSGIGFEVAKLLSAENNQIIIVGRNNTKLNAALEFIPNGVHIAADITDDSEVNRLVEQIKNQYSNLSLLINNAGTAHAIKNNSRKSPRKKPRIKNYLMGAFGYCLLTDTGQLL